MFCTKCGKEIENDALFCSNCGAKQANTYKEVFDDVKLYRVQTDDVNTSQNLIIVGIKGNPDLNDEKYDLYSELLDTEIKNYQSYKKIVTDDFVPIGI